MTHRLASLALVGCLLVPAGGADAGLDPFIGEIAIFGFNFAPRDWAKCDGQLLAISSFSALFSLLGCTYGGDCRTNFALPDLRGRVPMHFGNGPGLSPRSLGEKGGSEITSSAAAHSHAASATAMGTDTRGDVETPGGHLWARKARERDYASAPPEVPLAAMHGDAIEVVVSPSGPASVNNLQPYLVLNFSIALDGQFPSRP